MEKNEFGDSQNRNKAAVRTLPTDFFGSEYFAPNASLRRLSSAVYALGRERRLSARRRLLGF